MSLLSMLGLAQAEDIAQDVVVRANPLARVPDAPAQVQAPPLPEKVSRTAPVADQRIAPEQKELIPRKGMFGVKGTLRDVLGIVGDSLLIGSGKNAIYTPHREKEKMGSAAYGFNQSPEEAQNAIGRLLAGGYVNEAQQMQDILDRRTQAQLTQQSLQESRNSQIADRQYKMRQDFGNYAARLLAGVKTPEQLEVVKEVLQQRAAAADIDTSAIFGEGGLGAITPENAAVFGRGDMTVNQQQMLPLQERRTAVAEGQLGVAQRNAASGETRAAAAMKNANRPRPGPRPAQPTEASETARIRGKLNRGEKLSPGDQQTWDRYRNGTGKKGKFGLDTSNLGLPPGFSGARKKQ